MAQLVLVHFCDYWLSQEVPLKAAAALLQFDTYLRPGETLALKKGHVLSPVRRRRVSPLGCLQFARPPNTALRNLALKMTLCSSASLAGFGLWVFCGHYMLRHCMKPLKTQSSAGIVEPLFISLQLKATEKESSGAVRHAGPSEDAFHKFDFHK